MIYSYISLKDLRSWFFFLFCFVGNIYTGLCGLPSSSSVRLLILYLLLLNRVSTWENSNSLPQGFLSSNLRNALSFWQRILDRMVLLLKFIIASYFVVQDVLSEIKIPLKHSRNLTELCRHKTKALQRHELRSSEAVWNCAVISETFSNASFNFEDTFRYFFNHSWNITDRTSANAKFGPWGSWRRFSIDWGSSTHEKLSTLREDSIALTYSLRTHLVRGIREQYRHKIYDYLQ